MKPSGRKADCPVCRRHVAAYRTADGVWKIHRHGERRCKGSNEPLPITAAGIPVLFPSLRVEPLGVKE